MSQMSCIYNFGRAYHRDDWNFKVPGSVFWRVYLVVDGQAQVNIYGESHTLTPGHVYLIPAFVPHEDILVGEFIHDYLHFNIEVSAVADLLDEYDLAFEAPATPVICSVFERFAALCRGFELDTPVPEKYENRSTYIYLVHRNDSLPSADLLEINGGVAMILGHFLRYSRRKEHGRDMKLVTAKHMLDRSVDPGENIGHIAERVGMRPESFIRAFRKQYRITPHQYLTDARIKRAKSLLLFTSKSIKEVAVESGFGDSSYFCKQFRKFTSQTPMEFRMRAD